MAKTKRIRFFAGPPLIAQQPDLTAYRLMSTLAHHPVSFVLGLIGFIRINASRLSRYFLKKGYKPEFD